MKENKTKPRNKSIEILGNDVLALISWTGVAGSRVHASPIKGQDLSEVLDGNEEERILVKRKKSSKGKDGNKKLKAKKRSKKVKGERFDEILWSKIKPTWNLTCSAPNAWQQKCTADVMHHLPVFVMM